MDCQHIFEVSFKGLRCSKCGHLLPLFIFKGIDNPSANEPVAPCGNQN